MLLLIKFNKKKSIYTYENNKNIKGKMLHFHHLYYHYKRNYTIFLMKPSKNYIEHMYIWRASKKQINIMLKDKCPNKFIIIRP